MSTLDPEKGAEMAEKDSVSARSAEVAAFPTRSKTSLLMTFFEGAFLMLFVLSSKRFLSCAWSRLVDMDAREMIDGFKFDGTNELHSGAEAEAIRRGSKVLRNIILFVDDS
jgi:hypothetical protein